MTQGRYFDGKVSMGDRFRFPHGDGFVEVQVVDVKRRGAAQPCEAYLITLPGRRKWVNEGAFRTQALPLL